MERNLGAVLNSESLTESVAGLYRDIEQLFEKFSVLRELLGDRSAETSLAACLIARATGAGSNPLTVTGEEITKFEAMGSNEDLIRRIVDAVQTKDEALFLKLFYNLRMASRDALADGDKDKSRTTPGLFARPRPLQTQHGFARVQQAYADKNFKQNRDGDALVHRVKNADGHIDPVDVFIAPINSRFFSNDSPRFFPPPTLAELYKKLDWIGSSGPFTLAVIISLAVECDRPQVNLNDLMKELGLDPRSQKERDEYRALLWECLRLFAQTLVVGKVQGKYRDKKGNLIEFIEKAPVIAITGTEHPSEMRLDGSEAPVAVEYTLGSFYYRHRDNKQFLAYIGDLRLLAGIPGGKAAGQWARSIGLALLQHWREEASNAEIKRIGNDSHETVRFGKIPTRRELFERVRPDPNPFEILLSTSPKRARTYWDAAETMLVDVQFIAKPSVAKKWARQDWQDAWLDEPLDLRPHFEGNAITVDNVREVASASKTRRRRTRGRKKKSSSPANGAAS
jgi:hypothetical protein